MKRFARNLLAVAALALPGPALAAEIVVVAHGQANDPFWSVVKNGVELAAKHTGAKVDYRAPETFDMVAMSQLIDAAVNQEPDGLVVSIPDADAQPAGVATIAYDVTERKRALEALERSERRFKDFASLAADYFWEVDADFRITFVKRQRNLFCGRRIETKSDVGPRPTRLRRGSARSHIA